MSPAPCHLRTTRTPLDLAYPPDGRGTRPPLPGHRVGGRGTRPLDRDAEPLDEARAPLIETPNPWTKHSPLLFKTPRQRTRHSPLSIATAGPVAAPFDRGSRVGGRRDSPLPPDWVISFESGALVCDQGSRFRAVGTPGSRPARTGPARTGPARAGPEKTGPERASPTRADPASRGRL